MKKQKIKKIVEKIASLGLYIIRKITGNCYSCNWLNGSVWLWVEFFFIND